MNEQETPSGGVREVKVMSDQMRSFRGSWSAQDVAREWGGPEGFVRWIEDAGGQVDEVTVRANGTMSVAGRTPSWFWVPGEDDASSEPIPVGLDFVLKTIFWTIVIVIIGSAAIMALWFVWLGGNELSYW